MASVRLMKGRGTWFPAAKLLLAGLLSACGGGGSGGGGSALPPPSGGPTPTPPPSFGVAGILTDADTGAALGGATVTLGALPNATTCNRAQTDTFNACGAPTAPVLITATNASGQFSLALAAGGTYMLAIAAPSYATFHRVVSASPAGRLATAIITAQITHLTADEIAWLADFNNRRATISLPHSFPNLAVDEYAERQARRWAADVAAGITQYGDAGWTSYANAYGASPGAMYIVGAIGDLVPPPQGQWSTADGAWFAEKANCPGGNWQTCQFASNTGHYIEASNTSDVWVGLGESLTSFNYPPFGQQYAYGVMIIGNNAGPGPPSNRIVTSLARLRH